jgi:hypothetical protein
MMARRGGASIHCGRVGMPLLVVVLMIVWTSFVRHSIGTWHEKTNTALSSRAVMDNIYQFRIKAKRNEAVVQNRSPWMDTRNDVSPIASTELKRDEFMIRRNVPFEKADIKATVQARQFSERKSYSSQETFISQITSSEVIDTIDGTKNTPISIAYVVTITSCGNEGNDTQSFVEGAAVLQYSIQRFRGPGIQKRSHYDSTLYAIYHPDARPCVPLLEELGYVLVQRETPVAVEEIQGDFLREHIVTNGCCGEKELLKLEAFTLTHHPIVVLLDLDALILQPLDPLFDFMLHGKPLPVGHEQWPNKSMVPFYNVALMHTIDYAMVDPTRRIKPIQGGFLVLKPNLTIYEEFKQLVRVGDFRMNGGWGGRLGKFWGSMTIQGLLPYYFVMLHPGHTVELNWCIYNNMCSKPRKNSTSQDEANSLGRCYTQQEDCEDCRKRPLEDIYSVHFTVCQKPWLCQRHHQNNVAHRLCRQLHHAWFQIRSEMEQSWNRSGWGPETGKDRDMFFGYCTSFGSKGYQSIQRPFRQALSA